MSSYEGGGKASHARFIPHPSSLILMPLIAALLLAGCGFHLRGSATLPFEVLYVEAPPGSLFATQLRRVIGYGTKTRITTDQVQADATLQVVWASCAKRKSCRCRPAAGCASSSFAIA